MADFLFSDVCATPPPVGRLRGGLSGREQHPSPVVGGRLELKDSLFVVGGNFRSGYWPTARLGRLSLQMVRANSIGAATIRAVGS
jgi:hypothetical protein